MVSLKIREGFFNLTTLRLFLNSNNNLKNNKAEIAMQDMTNSCNVLDTSPKLTSKLNFKEAQVSFEKNKKIHGNKFRFFCFNS